MGRDLENIKSYNTKSGGGQRGVFTEDVKRFYFEKYAG